MKNKNSPIKAFLPRAIFIAIIAFPFLAMGAGANNARHQVRTGTSDYGKAYTIYETVKRHL